MSTRKYPRPWEWIDDELRDGEGKALLSADPDAPGQSDVRLMIALIPEMLVMLNGVVLTPAGEAGKGHLETVTKEIRELLAQIDQEAE